MEYKFRAWDKWKKTMIQPNDGDFIGWHAMKNWEECLDVMMFTGLKDKNGVDIYSNDVVYLAGYGDYLVEFPFIELYEAAAENDIGMIKGNIHENPELLTSE